MATASGSGSAPLEPTVRTPGTEPLPNSLEYRLQAPEGICAFDFFQAIRLLTLLKMKDHVQVGEDGPPQREIVRFLAHRSLAFPASAIQKMVWETATQPAWMTVNFMGLTGPSGVMPRPYTERLWVEGKGAEKTALQDWLDLFNHRFISLFFRAWEKNCFYLPFERGEAFGRDPDRFSRALYSLIGLGFRSHRNRFRVAYGELHDVDPSVSTDDSAAFDLPIQEKELARLDDLALLRFGGLFAHRPRCAVSLEIFLQTYLNLPVKVMQFQGQWLHMNESSQTSIGARNNSLGRDTLVGDRIWDVQSKIRIRLGPLSYETFLDFLPDRTPQIRRKRIFLLAQLVQFYLGAEFDFEFQLLLKKEEVPTAATGPNSRLGWNMWSRAKPYPQIADEAVFVVSDQALINPGQ